MADGRGRPNKGPRTKYQMYLPDELFRNLRIYSAAKAQDMSDVITEVLSGWWEAQPEKEKAKYEALKNSPSEPTTPKPGPKKNGVKAKEA